MLPLQRSTLYFVVPLLAAFALGLALRVAPASALPGPRTVFFLIDDSTCLFGSTLNERLAKEAIAEAAFQLMERFEPEDRAGVISFGDGSALALAPTADAAAVRDAILGVEMLDRSARLDLAYTEALSWLDEQPSGSLGQVVTLALTDGPMMAAPDRATIRSRELEVVHDAVHFAIGIGPITQHALLQAIASRGGYRYIALGGDVIGAMHTLGDRILDDEPAAPPPTLVPTETPTPPPPTATPTAVPVFAPVFLPSLLREQG